ncbi:hypothetical protein ABET51_06840 [Metabacillus fastidiosus]|uniref:hypothetical protein n=1 Tax=Metabacillus fastidiosus TaxID=1458 RepID=UPI003D2730BF
MEKFDIKTLTEIRDRLDYIHTIATTNYSDNPELMDTIDHLARVGAMFADIKIEELEGHIETADPQNYILEKLSSSYFHMKNYEKNNQY